MAIVSLVKDDEFKARVLVDATIYGDKEAAVRNEIHRRTIRKYREEFYASKERAELFLGKLRQLEAEWADGLNAYMLSGLDYLKRAATELPYTPEGVHAVTGSIKLISEIQQRRMILQYRMRSLHGLPDDLN